MAFHLRAIALIVSTTACAASNAPGEPRAPLATSRRVEISKSSDERAASLESAPFLERSLFVRRVLESNPSVDAARKSLDAALARARGAGAFPEPMLDVGVAPLSLVSSNARPGYELRITQQLPWFGKRGLEQETSRAEALAVKQDLAMTRRDLALSAVSLWDQYYLVERSLSLSAQHTVLAEQLRQSALAAIEVSRGSPQAVLEADSELAELERDAASLRAERDVIRAQMNELLHREPDAPLAPAPAELRLERRAGSPQGAQGGSALRPEVAAARAHARAESLRAERAERDSYPDLALSTSYSSMWDMPEHRWMLGVSVNLPIASGRRTSAVDEARAMRAHYESEALRLEGAAKTEIYVAMRRVKESEQVLALFEKRSLPLAREQVESLRAGIPTSTNTLSMLLMAERKLRQVELDYQTARAACDRRLAELERALGKIPGLGEEVSP